MSRNSRSSKGKQKQDNHRVRVSQGRPDMNYEYIEPPVPERRVVEPLRALTRAQGEYMSAIQDSTIIFGIGPAGTGKTFCAVAMACEQLQDKQISKLYFTRPKVPAGEEFGHLPGEIENKFLPFLLPVLDTLEQRLSKSTTEYMIKHKRIEAKPIAFMRGITVTDAWLIIDEAQNLTPTQMLMVLTRAGQNCKILINGDLSQKDIKTYSGLADAINRLAGLRRVAIVEFEREDCVRSGIVRDILERYEGAS